PALRVVDDAAREVMEERPEGLVRVTLIEALRERGREVDGHEPVALFPAAERFLSTLIQLGRRFAGPADPQAPHPRHDGTDRRGQAAGAALGPPAFGRAAQGQGQAVRDDDQPPASRFRRRLVRAAGGGGRGSPRHGHRSLPPRSNRGPSPSGKRRGRFRGTTGPVHSRARPSATVSGCAGIRISRGPPATAGVVASAGGHGKRNPRAWARPRHWMPTWPRLRLSASPTQTMLLLNSRPLGISTRSFIPTSTA